MTAIAAHYAITAPRMDDSLDDLRQSVTANVGFARGRFRAVAFRWSNSTFPEWSLTEEFERLIPRYWPWIQNKSRKSRTRHCQLGHRSRLVLVHESRPPASWQIFDVRQGEKQNGMA
jgi:hypothetical protein